MSNAGIKETDPIGDTIAEYRGGSALKRKKKKSQTFFLFILFHKGARSSFLVRAPLPRLFIAIKR